MTVTNSRKTNDSHHTLKNLDVCYSSLKAEKENMEASLKKVQMPLLDKSPLVKQNAKRHTWCQVNQI